MPNISYPKRRLLGSLLAPPVPRRTRHIYISLESYLRGESNGIGYVAWDEVFTENVIHYYNVPLPAETDIGGTLASI